QRRKEKSRILTLRFLLYVFAFAGKLFAKALLKVGSCVAQAQPFLEDLWRLQPNGQPLRYLARKFPVAIFLAGRQQLEFVFDLQHELTQMFKRRRIVLKFFAQTLDLLDQSKRS